MGPVKRLAGGSAGSAGPVPGFDQAGLVSQDDGLHAVAQAQLAQQAVDVRLDGCLGQVQARGDLSIGQAFGDEQQDLTLAGEYRSAISERSKSGRAYRPFGGGPAWQSRGRTWQRVWAPS